MTEWTKEMRNTIYDIMDKTDIEFNGLETLDTICECCPYAKQCASSKDMIFGCGAWEEYMGADI